MAGAIILATSARSVLGLESLALFELVPSCYGGPDAEVWVATLTVIVEKQLPRLYQLLAAWSCGPESRPGS